MMHPQKTTLLKGLDNPQFCDRVLKKKRSQNAQPQSEILRSKGFGGAALNKQFVGLWIATSIACVNMLPLKTWYLKTMR